MTRNFGMPHPEGYRKALRIMRLAERFSMPILTFVDTPGAYPGIEAEERGQVEAVARNIMEMFEIRVPILVFIVGEGEAAGRWRSESETGSTCWKMRFIRSSARKHAPPFSGRTPAERLKRQSASG